jgi:hypothetical protein
MVIRYPQSLTISIHRNSEIHAGKQRVKACPGQAAGFFAEIQDVWARKPVQTRPSDCPDSFAWQKDASRHSRINAQEFLSFLFRRRGPIPRPSGRLKFTILLVAGVWIPAYYPIPPGTGIPRPSGRGMLVITIAGNKFFSEYYGYLDVTLSAHEGPFIMLILT